MRKEPKLLHFDMFGPATNMQRWPADVPAGPKARQHMIERLGKTHDQTAITMPAKMLRMLLVEVDDAASGGDQ